MTDETPAGLARRLRDGGYLTDGWYEAFVRVRREDFTPDRIWFRDTDGYRPLERGADPDQWRALVYDDHALVTQVEDDGGDMAFVPSSSASMPRVVAVMLDALDVHNGQRVLETGTGTGYNAALLAERFGDHNVTTIEADPQLADTARASLKTAGYTPTVRTGDGARGCLERAPYHRIIATYALHRIPHTLVAQATEGGLIVLPWGTGLYNGVLLRLTVHGDGTASGPVIGDSAFMWDRTQSPDRDVMAAIDHCDQAATGRTALDPRCVLGDENAAFTAGVLVPDCRYAVGHGPDGEFTLWFADRSSGSWASVDYTPTASEFDIHQHGPRRLWDELESAYTWWQEAGSPQRTRYGLTVTPTGQHTWLDSPDRPVPRLAS